MKNKKQQKEIRFGRARRSPFVALSFRRPNANVNKNQKTTRTRTVISLVKNEGCASGWSKGFGFEVNIRNPESHLEILNCFIEMLQRLRHERVVRQLCERARRRTAAQHPREVCCSTYTHIYISIYIYICAKIQVRASCICSRTWHATAHPRPSSSCER